MDSYKSDIQTLQKPVEDVYNRLAHPGNLQDKISSLPADVQEKLKGVTFDDHSISFTVQPVGAIKLNVTERVECERIELKPEGLPIDLTGKVLFAAASPTESTLQVVLDIDLPFFMKAMAGSKINDAVQQLAATLAKSLA